MPDLDFPTTLWSLMKDARTAICRVHEHPRGLELRYVVDDVLLCSDIVGSTAELEVRANEAREGFTELGWSPHDVP